MSMGRVIAVIFAVAAIVLFIGKWLARGIESGWN